MSAPQKITCPYGAWPSVISIDQALKGSARYGALEIAGESIFWSEGRPEDGGRTSLCRWTPQGGVERVILPPWNIRSRVHEYGGGAYTLGSGRLFFSEDSDGAIYVSAWDERPPKKFAGESGLRFADLTWDAGRQVLYAVMEDHRIEGQEPENTLVAIDAEGEVSVLHRGADFYSNPTISPDGESLVFLSWDHPQMPWDGTTLSRIHLDSKSRTERLVGGPKESLFQPTFGPDGTLYVVSDRSGWWNIYSVDPALSDALEPVLLMPAEFATPQWEFGMRTFAVGETGEIVAIARQHGEASIGLIRGGTWRPLETEYCEFRGLKRVGDTVVCFAGSRVKAEHPVRIDLHRGTITPLVEPSGELHDAHFSSPRSIEFKGSGGRPTQAFFYAPHSETYVAPEDEKPPVIVMNHGGPTASTNAMLRLMIQFWTSRGFAVLDINYGGSTGFGRAYRERLQGQWGIVDVEDAVAAIQELGTRGDIDPKRAAIRGSSAGGFTTLAALTFHAVFKAGVSLYGIGDLRLLALDTHKFESRYMDSLIAPWPEGAKIYEARSPITHIDRFQGALLLLQGAEDKVVPPNQALTMYEAIKARGCPVAYLLFENEQHGFRQLSTLKRALEAELYFYGQVLGFTPADPVPAIPIDNLP